MNPNKSAIVSATLLLSFATAGAHAQGRQANCSALPTAEQLKQFLAAAPSHGGEAGGLFSGARMGAAVGHRNRGLCAVPAVTDEPAPEVAGGAARAPGDADTAATISLGAPARPNAKPR